MDKRRFVGMLVGVAAIGLQTGIAVKALCDKRKAQRRADKAELGEAIYKFGYDVQEIRIKHLKDELEKSKSDRMVYKPMKEKES